MNQKNKSLLIGLAVLAVLAYQNLISNTFQSGSAFFKTKNQIEKQRQQLLINQNDQNELVFIDKQIKTFVTNIDDFESHLLRTINQQSDRLGIRIISLGEPKETQIENLKQHTFEIQLQGAYEPTLKMLRQLEVTFPQSKIIHVKMFKKKHSKNPKSLMTQLLLTNYH